MIQNSSKSLIILLMATVLLSACEPKSDVSVKPVYPDITIAEAKAWFVPQSAGAKVGSEKPATRRTEFWNLAQKQTYANGLSVVVVPLTYNYDQATASKQDVLGGKKSVDKTDYMIQKKLLIYKDPKGNILADVITVIPTDDNRKKNKKVKGDSFDGYVLAYDNAEKKFMGGWYYENGKPTNRARLLTGKGGRVMGDCDILVYKNEGPNPPAQVGGGGLSDPSSGFWDGGGNHWQLDYTISLDCGNGFGGSTPPSNSQGSNTGDVAWFWNASPGGGGGGGGGGSAPYTPIMIGDNGLIGGSQADNFFYDMNYNHSPSIYFDEEEQAVIRDYPLLISSLQNYIDQYGQKPDGSNAFILSAADQAQYPRFTELVRNLPGFVEQHERVKQALIRHTHLAWSKIRPLLKFGSGPKIVVNELTPATYYGHTVYPAYPEPFIEISARYVRGLEAANLSGTKEATAFLLSVTLLHELTHYGAVDGGRNESRNDEFGDEFEREVLGTTITKDNAGRLLVDFNKQN